MRALWTRLRALWRVHPTEAELDEEIAFHLSEEAEERAAAGTSMAEAHSAARRELGSTALTVESMREAWRSPVVAQVAQDLRYAWRQLRRAPVFAVVAVLTLAVGIGSATTILGIVNRIVVQPLPYPDADRLVRIVERLETTSGTRERAVAYADFLEWRAEARTLSDMASIAPMAQRTFKTSEGVAAVWGAMTSGNVFDVLRTRPHLGRLLRPADEKDPQVVLLTYDTWRRLFAADPAVVGKAIELRVGALQAPTPPRLLTVVGVLPPEFAFERYDFFTPVFARPGAQPPPVTLIGRLAKGITIEAANQEAGAIGPKVRPPLPADAPALIGLRFDAISLKERSIAEMRPALRLFVAGVAVLLVIVCANVANLLLARGSSRHTKFATRIALGASRSRIVRQVLTESLLLAGLGAGAGATLATGALVVVRSLASTEATGIFRLMFGTTVLPRSNELHADWSLLVIAITVGLVSTVVFGLIPALHISRTNVDIGTPLRSRSHHQVSTMTRSGIVVSQVALTTLLLISAGLLIRSVGKLVAVNKGYDATRVVAANLLLPDQYAVPAKAEAIRKLLAAMRALPSVQAAGFARHGLLIGEEIVGQFVPAGKSPDVMAGARIRFRPVSGGFLTAMGVDVIAGRDFADDDDDATEPLIVMNEQAARVCFGDAAATGQNISWTLRGHTAQFRVVGVVANVRQSSLTDEFVPEVFLNYRQLLRLTDSWGESPGYQNETAIGFLSFAIRTAGDPAALIPAIRESLRRVDANIGIDALVPLSEVVNASVTRPRFYAAILAMLATLAALLAGVGVYGVLAYSVTERTPEIGIRLALGARSGHVLSPIVGQIGIMSGVGLALGLGMATATTPLLQGLLFGVEPIDMVTFLVVPVLVGAIAIAAAIIPGWRAIRVHPATALR